MNPIRALLWKEGREATYKIAAGAGLALAVGLVCTQEGVFSYHREIQPLSHLIGLFGAVLMGMDLIAQERSRMTLTFLLCRPLAPWKILAVKFTVGAAGLMTVLASYWGGTFIGLLEWGDLELQSWAYSNRTYKGVESFPVEELLLDVGYIRVVLLWFVIYLIPYCISVLASTLTDRPLKAAMTSLMAVWVGLFLLVTAGMLAPKFVEFYLRLVFSLELNSHAGILRQAFDPSLILARVGAIAMLVSGVLLCAFWVFGVQASRRFQWAVGALALICTVVVIGLDVTQSRQKRTPVEPVAPVGHLKYKMPAMGLALNNELAAVLLERGLSVVDVSDVSAPTEIGQVEMGGWRLERLALTGSRAYVWGEFQDSVGVVTFDLSRPNRPQLQALSLLYPVEEGPAPWLRRIPRLVGWGVSHGHLYAGLLRKDFLELHSFDVRKSGPPPLIHVLPIEETTKHVWDHEWEMQIVGSHTFLTLGQEFAVLDLTDPGRPETLSRIPLRRFGRAATYEKLVQEFREQATSTELTEPLVQMFEEYGPNLAATEKYTYGTHGRHISFVVPPGLGPLTVGNSTAYIERHLPREIAVVDISDPLKPVEVDYIPWTRLPRQMTFAGDTAYALTRGGIRIYVEASYGPFRLREKLGFADYKRESQFFVNPKTRVGDLARDMFILGGDHIYALLDNKLAIFENPGKTE